MFRFFKSIEEIRATTQFPPRNAFFNKIKQKELPQSEYDEYKKLYDGKIALPSDDPNKWTNMSDYLKHYNCLDVEPLVEALSKCFEKFREYFHVDPGTKYSLPSIAFQSMMNHSDQSLPFASTYPDIKHGNQVRLMLRGKVDGGVSEVYHR